MINSKRLITTCLSVLMVISAIAANSIEVQDPVSSLLGGTFALAILITFAVLYFIWYIFVAIMARNRNRNVALWILFSLLGTPLLMMLILFCIGKDKSEDKRYND